VQLEKRKEKVHVSLNSDWRHRPRLKSVRDSSRVWTVLVGQDLLLRGAIFPRHRYETSTPAQTGGFSQISLLLPALELTTMSILPMSLATFSATSETVQPLLPAYRLLVAIYERDTKGIVSRLAHISRVERHQPFGEASREVFEGGVWQLQHAVALFAMLFTWPHGIRPLLSLHFIEPRSSDQSISTIETATQQCTYHPLTRQAFWCCFGGA